MKIADVIHTLEQFAPISYQENYDNAGLITGSADWHCTGIICALDATEKVIVEAMENKCNLIVSHHPIIFNGLKKITGKNYVEKSIIAAIRNNIAIYSIHTNLDNVLNGVNNVMADKLELINRKILAPKQNELIKLFTFVPVENAEAVRTAIFKAGGGNIGNYSECSFNVIGIGTFKAQEKTHPFVGEIGKRHEETEIKMEMIFPAYLKDKIIGALIQSHPYEEPAYDLFHLSNDFKNVGSGLIGELSIEISETELLQKIKQTFNLSVIRCTNLLNKNVKKIAVCGGAGSFLIKNAIAENADFFVTADVKYHEFFDANNQMVIADIGHWESEQFTIDLLVEIISSKFSNFAVRKTKIKTNPVNYFV